MDKRMRKGRRTKRSIREGREMEGRMRKGTVKRIRERVEMDRRKRGGKEEWIGG